jgi:hypothetical protein
LSLFVPLFLSISFYLFICLCIFYILSF